MIQYSRTYRHSALVIMIAGILLSTPERSTAATSTISITGSVKATPCSIDETGYTMSIPAADISEFSGPGTESSVIGKVNVNISCPTDATVDISVSGTGAIGTAGDVVAIDQTDRGIGIRLTRDNDIKLDLNTPFSKTVQGGVPLNVQFRGRYQQLPTGTVTAGNITSSVTLNVTTR